MSKTSPSEQTDLRLLVLMRRSESPTDVCLVCSWKKRYISLRFLIYLWEKFLQRKPFALRELWLESSGLYEETIPMDWTRLCIRQGQLTLWFWASTSPPSSSPSSSLDPPTEVAETPELVLQRGLFFAPRLLSFFKAFFHFRLCSSSSWTWFRRKPKNQHKLAFSLFPVVQANLDR